jgi:hypothetical protein
MTVETEGATPEGALEAINEVLGSEPPAPAAEETAHVGDEGAADGTETGAEGGEHKADEGKDDAAGEKPEGEHEGDDADGHEGQTRNPDGTWGPKKAADKKDGEGEKGQKPEDKKPDPINDPIPKDLKPATQERIRTLVKTTRELTEARDKVQNDFNYMVQGVQATGATPEQYGEALSWLALFNSNDPTQQAKALELVENVADRLATLLGKERTVNDPLAAHPDLVDAVQKGQVTAKYAREIARTRAGQQLRTELTTAASQEQQQQQTAQRELQDSRTALNTLETTLRAQDPNYEAIKAQIVPILRPIMKALPPSQWPSAFREAYTNAKAGFRPAPAPAPAGGSRVPANQPMRAGKNPAGGGAKAPGSMLDAVSAALANMK